MDDVCTFIYSFIQTQSRFNLLSYYCQDTAANVRMSLISLYTRPGILFVPWRTSISSLITWILHSSSFGIFTYSRLFTVLASSSLISPRWYFSNRKRMFRPVVDWQSYCRECRRHLSANFLLLLIFLMKLMNRLWRWNIMCFVSLIGSIRYLWVFRSSLCMTLWDTFHVFRTLSTSLLCKSHNVDP